MTRLLIVDDDTNLRHTLGYAFRQEGFEVITAADGEQALSNFRQSRPDLVILDVMLPGRDGFDVARSLRRESDVPVIMLTARDSELDKVVGLEIGADDYLAKPFSTRELIARVRAMLRRARRTEPARADTRVQIDELVLDGGRRRSFHEQRGRKGEQVKRSIFAILVATGILASACGGAGQQPPTTTGTSAAADPCAVP